jgi:type IV pilus assembly protein PilW
MTNNKINATRRQSGLTLVEILVALTIGSFLMVGALQVYSQSRHAFVINESIARVQETAQFAIDTIEADLRMASNWGRHSRGVAIEGRSLQAVDNPNALAAPGGCGVTWALNVGRPVQGDNNGYTLPCPAQAGAQLNSDTVTTRRATVAPTALQPGRLQLQTTRIQGEIFDDGVIPPSYNATTSETHDLLVNTYYVAADSNLIPGVPTLRRKSLQYVGGAASIIDQEVAPGVENIQVQFGVDVDADNSVDRYVDPDDPIIDPDAAGYIPGSRVITTRLWLVVRGLTPEVGITDTTNYAPGDVDLGTFNDQFRRTLVSKTILMRNARS